jgi:hypothetical protein
MRYTRALCPVIGLLLSAMPLRSQNVNPMHPEEIQVQKHQSPEDLRARVASVQFQKDVKELADLCASVSKEMDGLKEGLVAQDLVEKLKRVEKLSKHVREQLSHATPAP